MEEKHRGPTTGDARVRSRCAVLVVGWGGPQALSQSMPALQRSLGPADRVFIVDNRMSDATKDWVHAQGDSRLAYVRPAANLGFAGAVNHGAAIAVQESWDWYVVLSDDSLTDGLFRNTLDELAARTEISIVGPLAYSSGSDVPHFLARRLDLWKVRMVDKDPDDVRFPSSDYVEGRCFAVRPALFHELGGLDEALFIYFEEIDFCLRARRKGHKVVVDLQSKVVDTGVTTASSDRRNYLMARNRIYLVGKHGSIPQLVFAVGVIGGIEGARAYRAAGRGRAGLHAVALQATGIRDGVIMILRSGRKPSPAI